MENCSNFYFLFGTKILTTSS
uniref:Uncharacterized protein n=1 Tax=Anopheles dirus TaxID=7168 RepID=A0A182NW72_9DIPT